MTHSTPRKQPHLIALLALATLLTSTVVAGQSYDFQSLPVPSDTWTRGANNQDLIVGYIIDPDDGSFEAFVSDGTDYETYVHPGATITNFLDINDAGAIVGYVFDDNGNRGLLLDRNGEETLIDMPGFEGGTVTWAMNNRGQIAGFYCPSLEPLCGGGGLVQGSFLRSRGGEYVLIEVPDALATVALGINDLGRVVGLYIDAVGAVRGFSWSRRTGYSLIDVPDASWTELTDANDRGDLAGSYIDADGGEHGFVRTRDGELHTIDFPGAESTRLQAITDSGDLAGFYIDAETGARVGFFAERQ